VSGSLRVMNQSSTIIASNHLTKFIAKVIHIKYTTLDVEIKQNRWLCIC